MTIRTMRKFRGLSSPINTRKNKRKPPIMMVIIILAIGLSNSQRAKLQ